MKALLVALGAGLSFGGGLVLSGMTDPRRVQAFLTLDSSWDPSLLWVMGGAVAVHMLLLRLTKARLKVDASGVESRKIDQRLVLGAVIFGVGWGLTGYCPGPSFVGSGAGHLSAIVFFIAMIAGIAAYHLIWSRRAERTPEPVESPLPAAHASTIIDT